ncbi:hypothetical protein T484DRAFT_3108635 [Baffinella frigidus]|nr:hypothetical protein T484DRAFT_3108635 [Cryptophyta sp. CCMP2293]
MGRSSGKQNKFSGGGGGGAPGPDEGGMKHSAHFEAEEIRILLEQKPRMSWEEYKEKHKDQLSDKMGMGIEREQAEYRKQLDEERELRLARGVNKGKDGKDGKGAKKDKKDKKDKSDKKEKKKSDHGMIAAPARLTRTMNLKRRRRRRRRRRRAALKMRRVWIPGPRGMRVASEEGPVRLSDFHKGHYDD